MFWRLKKALSWTPLRPTSGYLRQTESSIASRRTTEIWQSKNGVRDSRAIQLLMRSGPISASVFRKSTGTTKIRFATSRPESFLCGLGVVILSGVPASLHEAGMKSKDRMPGAAEGVASQGILTGNRRGEIPCMAVHDSGGYGVLRLRCRSRCERKLRSG